MEQLLKAPELAQLLRVNVKDLYRRALLGEIPSYKLGKSRRFRLEEVLAAMRDPGPAVQHIRKGFLHAIQERRGLR